MQRRFFRFFRFILAFLACVWLGPLLASLPAHAQDMGRAATDRSILSGPRAYMVTADTLEPDTLAPDTLAPDTLQPETPDPVLPDPDTVRPQTDPLAADSMAADDGSDTTGTTDPVDLSVPEEAPAPSPPWSLQARSVLSSQKQRAGVDLSGSQVTVDGGLRLGHASGAYADVVGTRRLGADGLYQQTAITGGYSLSLSDAWDLTGDVTLYRYPNDSVNALAQSPASFSLSADWAGEEWEAGVSVERFLGTNTFTYLTGSTGYTVFLTDDASVFVTPAASVSFASSTYIRKATGRSVRSRVSLSAIVLDVFVNADIGAGFSLFADPTLMISNQKDLLKVLRGSANAVERTLQPLLTIGLRYSLRF
ncbi:MAG: hypothetical protein ACKO9V_00795 [Candidatus Kapaibacterium sp.]